MEPSYENITLKNAGDVIDARRGIVNESHIHKITTLAIVEAKCQVLCISEDVRRRLGLNVLGEKVIQMANGTSKICKVTDMIEVHRRNGYTFMSALVFPGVNEVLLVTAPLEGMRLIKKNEPRHKVMGFRRYYKELVSG